MHSIALHSDPTLVLPVAKVQATKSPRRSSERSDVSGEKKKKKKKKGKPKPLPMEGEESETGLE